MSGTPQRVAAAEAPLSYPVGTILATSSPAVGVLIEAAQRRLVAVRDITAGEEIFRLVGRETRVATRYSIQVGPEMHLDSDDLATDAERVRDRYWMYLNHSCDPSAAVDGLAIVALRDVPAGGGVTFDYNATEWELAEPFDCHCGSASCLGTVRGYRHLDATDRARVAAYLSAYLLTL
jgi:hypothetical protein